VKLTTQLHITPNTWSYTSTLPLVGHRDNFTFYMTVYMMNEWKQMTSEMSTRLIAPEGFIARREK
jgi:hypothetical protein